MGVALPASFIDNPKKMALIRRHFNSVTAENEMKGMSLQPAEGALIFTNADKIVAFGGKSRSENHPRRRKRAGFHYGAGSRPERRGNRRNYC